MHSLSHYLLLVLILGAARMSIAASSDQDSDTKTAIRAFDTDTFWPQGSDPDSISPPVRSVALSRKLLQWSFKSQRPHPLIEGTDMAQVESINAPEIPGPCQRHCDVDGVKPEVQPESFT